MKAAAAAYLVIRVSAIILFALSLTRAAQVVDQTTLLTLTGGFTSQSLSVTQDLAQTFTVGRDGFLTQIDLQLARTAQFSLISHDLTIDLIAPTNSNSPLGTVLASATLHPSDIPTAQQAAFGQITSINITSAIPVTVGEQLSLVLTSDELRYPNSTSYVWIILPPVFPQFDKYPYGGAWRNVNHTGFVPFDPEHTGPRDFTFQTWVTPIPEPSSHLLALVAVHIGVSHGRRRRLIHPEAGLRRHGRTHQR
jgi:hypothetical protein